jgi:hypothetical protein
MFKKYAIIGLVAALAAPLAACDQVTQAADGNVAFGAIEINFGSAATNKQVVAIVQKIQSGQQLVAADVSGSCSAASALQSQVATSGLTGKLSTDVNSAFSTIANLPACKKGLTGTISDAGVIQGSLAIIVPAVIAAFK